MNDNKKRQVNWVFYAIIVLLIVFLIFISVKSPSGKKIEYSDFQDKVVAGEVTHIKTVGNTIYIRIKYERERCSTGHSTITVCICIMDYTLFKK